MDGSGQLQKNFNYISIKKNKIRYSKDVSEQLKASVDKEVEEWYNLEENKELLQNFNANAVAAYKLIGLRSNNNIVTRTINVIIKKHFENKLCCLTGVSDIEIDHKNGRYNNPRVNNTETQTIEDFQALSKHCNDAKRQHCKNCKSTNKRFDAKLLGYNYSYKSGTSDYKEGPNGCVGCYWYDVKAFRLTDIEDLV